MRFPWRRRDSSDRDLDEEIETHIALETERRIEEGEAPETAALSARRAFGNVGRVKEVTRQMWGGMWRERLRQDAALGFRMLRRSPGYSLFAVLGLTIGIGATTAVFSWIEGILLRPFSLVVGQERMVALTGTDRNGRTEVSWPDLQDLRRESTLFDSFIAEHIGGATLSIGERAERATGSVVSANYFSVLGIEPALGRFFLPGEDAAPGTSPVLVLSHRLWRSRGNLPTTDN